MRYKVLFTTAAERDLNRTLEYIEFSLFNPSSADALLEKVEVEVSKLAEFPRMYSVVQDDVLRAWGVRFVKINNYLAFFVISEEDNTVYVIRFLYGKRNWAGILRKEISFS